DFPQLVHRFRRLLALVAFVPRVAVSLYPHRRPRLRRGSRIATQQPGYQKWPGFVLSVPASLSKMQEAPMTEIEFNALAAQGYNRIPLITETYADLDTPLAIYLKLAHNGPEGGRNSCLLESVVGGERFGRYSFIGLPAKTVIRARGTTTEVVHKGEVVETHEGDPLAFIEDYQGRFKVALRPGMPRFAGGVAGYFGYDTVRHMEPRLGPATTPFPAGQAGRTPDIMLLQIDELVIVDNLAGRTYILVYADPSQPEAYALAKRRHKQLREKLRTPLTIPYAYASMQTQERRDFAKEDYLAAVRKAKDY